MRAEVSVHSTQERERIQEIRESQSVEQRVAQIDLDRIRRNLRNSSSSDIESMVYDLKEQPWFNKKRSAFSYNPFINYIEHGDIDTMSKVVEYEADEDGFKPRISIIPADTASSCAGDMNNAVRYSVVPITESKDKEKERLKFIRAVSHTKNKMLDAETDLQRPIKTMDVNNVEALQRNMAQPLAQLNAAIGSLVKATTRQ
ncbi:unnamed protein product [Parnassius apollo]|uniref:(apollo) hypothetical protein n=1 Tax=Parnassius apollo TaxID=110799 RepID=A0A8S3XDZ4_PARAO|nr:unnamed protein product [Parnassius apollo]